MWLVLTAAQPINSLCFVYDGLIYASGSFRSGAVCRPE